jgi:hypothetical protein
MWPEVSAMKTLALAVLLAVPMPVFGGGKDPGKTAPAYDPAKVITTTVIVTEVREVPKGDPIEGINFTVKAKGETFNVYVAPAAFVKMFGVTFKKDQQLDITGSKMKFEGADLLLAREIHMGQIDLVLRDENGSPFWLMFTIPTGE